jgi:hypothetical protein
MESVFQPDLSPNEYSVAEPQRWSVYLWGLLYAIIRLFQRYTFPEPINVRALGKPLKCRFWGFWLKIIFDLGLAGVKIRAVGKFPGGNAGKGWRINGSTSLR